MVNIKNGNSNSKHLNHKRRSNGIGPTHRLLFLLSPVVILNLAYCSFLHQRLEDINGYLNRFDDTISNSNSNNNNNNNNLIVDTLTALDLTEMGRKTKSEKDGVMKQGQDTTSSSSNIHLPFSAGWFSKKHAEEPVDDLTKEEDEEKENDSRGDSPVFVSEAAAAAEEDDDDDESDNGNVESNHNGAQGEEETVQYDDVVVRDDTTSIHDKDKNAECVRTPIGDLETTEAADAIDFADFLEGPGLQVPKNAKRVVCEFYAADWSQHFPHAMQQLYACWSWWEQAPASAERILLIPAEPHYGIKPLNPHISTETVKTLLGMVYTLQAAANVRLLTVDSEEAKLLLKTGMVRVKSIDIVGDSGHAYFMQRPEDARSLAATFLQHFTPDAPQTACKLTRPRIAILNRAGWRSFQNVADIQEALETTLGESVEVEYFEEADFRDQVAFFANTDILLTPHGGQVTGIPFMPTCGAVAEVFPESYYIPHFFGSLAHSAGLNHYAIYGSNGDWRVDNIKGLQDRHTMHKARNVHFCPDPMYFVDVVRKMLDDWRSCCRQSDVLISNNNSNNNNNNNNNAAAVHRKPVPVASSTVQRQVANDVQQNPGKKLRKKKHMKADPDAEE